MGIYQTKPFVRQLIDGLVEAGVPAEWQNTGGGCMAVYVPLADGEEILVTDAREPFIDGDYYIDDDIIGVRAVRFTDNDGEWEPVEMIFTTHPDDDEYDITDHRVEVALVALPGLITDITRIYRTRKD